MVFHYHVVSSPVYSQPVLNAVSNQVTLCYSGTAMERCAVCGVCVWCICVVCGVCVSCKSAGDTDVYKTCHAGSIDPPVGYTPTLSYRFYGNEV